MIRFLFRYKGGLKLDDHKAESNTKPIQRAALARRLYLPVQQHIGAPAKPVVAVGDSVLKGQMVGRSGEMISAPIHAPTSGTVVEIGEYSVPHASGRKALCVVIEPDGNDAWAEHHAPVRDYTEHTPEEIRRLISEAGIVGLGGAGFPSFVKLSPGRDRVVETLILNGAECEPYITCDDMLMRERPEDIIRGMLIMKHALLVQHCVIGVEENKPEAIRALRETIARLGIEDVQVVEVPALYPTGGEKQLIRILTGKEIAINKLPIEYRLVVHNVATAAAIYRAIRFGEPLISRVVTVTGGVARPCNLEVPFGTPIRDIIEQCGSRVEDFERIIMGGPMMGFAVPDPDAPVVKTTNCLIATSPAVMPLRDKQQAMPCIRCGKCAEVCPVSLLPQQIYWHARAKDFDKAQDYNLFDCIECGCCEYVCPSQIPLVQYYRYAKGEIWTRDQEKRKAETARQRHDFRQFRIEREKEERAARHKQKAAAVAAETSADDEKKAAIQAALERVKARQEAKAEQQEPE